MAAAADPPTRTRTDGWTSSFLEGEEVLRVEGLTKRFPGVTALSRVDFNVRAGEVHVLLGENGAGKTTLINVIAGTFPPDAGQIALSGEPIKYISPRDARAAGIYAVFQELSLVPQFTVAENLYLGREVDQAGLLRKRSMEFGAQHLLAALGFVLDVRARVDSLSRADQQLVEIAKAILGNPLVLIFDEPTAALSEVEASRLFSIISDLKGEGRAIIYITHRLPEIERVADRVTVLRDGQRVATVRADDVSQDGLIQLMSGRAVESLYPRVQPRPGRPILRLANASTARIRDVSIVVHEREIVGIAGLVGSGKADIGRVCVGLVGLRAGSVEIRGKAVAKPSVRSALDSGVVYYPSDRRREGLLYNRSVAENITLSALEQRRFRLGGFLRKGREREFVASIIRRLSIRPANPSRSVALLSGGNQQKVLFGRALLHDVAVHIFDEPTVGIDVVAKVEAYRFMNELCERGAGVLLISSDLPEVLGLAHRVFVIHDGRVQAELGPGDMAEARVLEGLFGWAPDGAAQGSAPGIQ